MILQGGLSTIVSARYSCPGDWNCSHETRWGLTSGSGAAIVVGAIGARKPKPTFDWGLALDDQRQAFHAALRFSKPDLGSALMRCACRTGVDAASKTA